MLKLRKANFDAAYGFNKTDDDQAGKKQDGKKGKEKAKKKK
jgi:hypothetical protein